MQSFHNRALTVSRIKSRLIWHTGKFVSGKKKLISRDCVMTQKLGLADKDFKAVVTMLKNVKKNMLLMNEKIVYVKEINYLKKEKNGNSRAEKLQYPK